MAKKGQKFNRYTEEYEKGENGGSVSLSKKYGISYRTIDTWIESYNTKRIKNRK